MKGKRGERRAASEGEGGGGLMKRIMNALSSKTNEVRTRAMIFFLLHRNGLLMMDKFRSLSHHRLLRRHHHHHRHRRRSGSSSRSFLQHEDDNINSYSTTYSDGEQLQMYATLDEEPRSSSSRAFLMHMIYNDDDDDNNNNKSSDILARTATQGASDNLISMREQKHDIADLTNDLFKQSKEDMIRVGTEVSKVDGEEKQQLQEEEDDIDLAADLFIQRFRRQIQLQKQLSLDSDHTQIMVPQIV